LIGDIFKACFEDFYFYENIFLSLKKEKLVPEAQQEITLKNLSYLILIQ